MTMDIISQKQKRIGSRAQAMVEFAIALPILLILLFGIMEVGRVVLMYSLVVNASRDAVRYGSAVGLDASGKFARYKYCDGIRTAAKNSGYFLNLKDSDITISYDHGPADTTPFIYCTATGGEDSSVVINSCDPTSTCDRVKVTVAVVYTPLVKLLPIKARTISSTSFRTIIGIAKIR